MKERGYRVICAKAADCIRPMSLLHLGDNFVYRPELALRGQFANAN